MTTLNVALTFRALTALGVPDTMLDRFPDEFRCGMEHRAGRLGDDTPSWDDVLRNLEVLLVVHAQSAEALDEEAGRLQQTLGEDGSGLELAHVQGAGLLGDQREHFGFTDGFSQPAIESAVTAAAAAVTANLPAILGRHFMLTPGYFAKGRR